MLTSYRSQRCWKLAGSLALQTITGCAAPEPQVPSPEARLSLVDYGIYYPAIRAQSGDTDTVAGYFYKVTSTAPSVQTDDVCARLGAAVGMRYSLLDPAPPQV